MHATAFSALLLFSFSAFAQQVIAVADGDTITILDGRKTTKVRLANIDAPEKAQDFGHRSKLSLSELCYRKTATLQTQAVDRYGRTVARVHCNGVDANRAQVERGMAWVYTKYNRDSSLPATERAARDARRGLWQRPDAVPPWEFRRHARAAKQAVLK